MKSNSSRGRSISTDSSVQNLFLNLTAMHSRLLEFIKKADDKRMWFEQLQDKQTQIKDSRAALDVLRQEHQEKLRQQAEEAERQRQLQMAYKLELMRKKKQEYLQYQRQLALQRIQEQEREMKMHQDQQKVMYSMAQMPYPNHPNQFLPPGAGQQIAPKNNDIPSHIMPNQAQIPPNVDGFQSIANNFHPHAGATLPRYPLQSQPNIYPNGPSNQMHPMQQHFQGPNGIPISKYVSLCYKIALFSKLI